jgi:hypothetical protein
MLRLWPALEKRKPAPRWIPALAVKTGVDSQIHETKIKIRECHER